MWRPLRQRIGPILLLLLLAGTLFPASGNDDKFITFLAARTLAQEGEILNYNGERVEQSSSLLFVLLLGFTHALLRDVPLPLLGLLFSLLGAVMTAMLAERIDRRLLSPGKRLHCAGFLVASSGFFVHWSTGATEITLAALALLLSSLGLAHIVLETTRRSLLLAAAAFLLAATVRPETPLVLIAAAIGLLTLAGIRRLVGTSPDSAHPRSAIDWRPVLPALGLLVMVSLAVTGFRWWYFDSFFPQPVMVKASPPFGLDRFFSGLRYLLVGASGRGGADLPAGGLVPFLVPLAGLALWEGVSVVRKCARRGPAKKRDCFLTCSVFVIAAQLGFILAVGGDWMAAGRFLVPVIPLLALLAAGRLSELTPKARTLGVIGLVLTQLVGSVVLSSRRHNSSLRLWEAALRSPTIDSDKFSWYERTCRVHLRDLDTIVYLDRIVRGATRQGLNTLTIWTGQMGIVPFYLASRYPGKIRFVDRVGLTDRILTRCAGAWHLPDCEKPPLDLLYRLRPPERIPPGLVAGRVATGQRQARSSVSGACVRYGTASFVAVSNAVAALLGDGALEDSAAMKAATSTPADCSAIP